VAAAAIDRIVAVIAFQDVITRPAPDLVITTQPQDPVIARQAAKVVISMGTHQPCARADDVEKG
jgi:hypothetical protein